jgi:hypothetical protein
MIHIKAQKTKDEEEKILLFYHKTRKWEKISIMIHRNQGNETQFSQTNSTEVSPP